MTLNEIYLYGKKELIKAGIESSAFDAMQIFNFCFNLNRQDIIKDRFRLAEEKKAKQFLKFIEERAQGRPLQYILGHWSFMDTEFEVGEGVLIPREDTEVLVKAVLSQIERIKNPQILDLCAGPGTVSITLAKKRKDANILAIEISEIALNYLKNNIKKNNIKNVTPISFDVFKKVETLGFKDVDIIVSNPPYIPTKDLKGLQKEVQHEPMLALDGGEEGLNFYYAIAQNWVKLLKEKGIICVEIGQGQSKRVIEIFKRCGISDIEAKKDINGIDRVICGRNS